MFGLFRRKISSIRSDFWRDAVHGVAGKIEDATAPKETPEASAAAPTPDVPVLEELPHPKRPHKKPSSPAAEELPRSTS